MKNKENKIDIQVKVRQAWAEFYAHNYEASCQHFFEAFESNPSAWWLAMEAIRSVRAQKRIQTNMNLTASHEVKNKLLFFTPDYSLSNSYQKNLYSEAGEMGFNSVPVKNSNFSLEFAKASNLCRFVFHQHWLKEIYWGATSEEDGLRRINRYVGLLKAYKGFGAHVVWSLHNLLDHDATPLQELLSLYANREMARVSDRIYVHDKTAGMQLSAQCRFDVTEKCFLLEHPLYDELLNLENLQLPPELNLSQIKLADHPDRRIVLHVGMIRPYKGVPNLLRAFDAYTRRNPAHGLILVIAGQIADQDVSGILTDLDAVSRQRIIMISRRVSDEEITALMRIADVSVTPYKKILTSGSFYLATTFKKPTVAPAIGMFPDVIKNGYSGYLYDGSVNGLEAALTDIGSMSRSHLAEMGKRVFDAHSNLSARNISQRFFSSLDSINSMKTIAHDAMWQEPARTEKHAYQLIRRAASKIPGAMYLAFPWASLIDATERKTPQAQVLEEALDSLLLKQKGGLAPIVVSVCQHIKYRKYLTTFRRAGVTDLYCSHAEIGCHIEHGIRIWPFQLFPAQCPAGANQSIEDPNLLVQEFLARDINFSYVGAFDARYYLTNSRHLITEKLSSVPNSYIKKRGEWHYEKQVYTEQVFGINLNQDEKNLQSERELEYREILTRSKFALCPSGTGPNSIRFWEALEFGCIPILLSDKMALPGDEEEWMEAVLRVAEESHSIERIPALIQSVLADQAGLSERLAACHRMREKYGVQNMVQHLLETTRSQAAALSVLSAGVGKTMVFIDGRQHQAEAVSQIVECVQDRFQRAGVEACIVTWSKDGIARDEKGNQICHACEPLSLVDTSRPFGLIFKLHNLTEKIARGLPQLIFQPVDAASMGVNDAPAEEATFDVTLISSVFKGKRFLPAFLESTSAYTSRHAIEHLLIIAASPEDELSLIAQHQNKDSANINVIYLPKDPGLYEVWNFGLSLSSGRYVGNTNLDDFRAPHQIEMLVDLLEKTPEADVASAAIAVASEPTGDWSKIKDMPVWYDNINNGCYRGKDLYRIDAKTGQIIAHNIPHCLPLWRRSLHDKYGFFDERHFGPSADWEFWLRCGAAGVEFVHLNQVLGIYYKNESTYWRRNPDTKQLEKNIIHRHFKDGMLLNQSRD